MMFVPVPIGSAGGGVELPAVIAAGETIVHHMFGESAEIKTTDYYADVGSGWGFKAEQDCQVRVKYLMTAYVYSSGYIYARLCKNNTLEVTNSSVYATNSTSYSVPPLTKVIDFNLASGDEVRLQIRTKNTLTKGRAYFFSVSILAADMQTELENAVTPL